MRKEEGGRKKRTRRGGGSRRRRRRGRALWAQQLKMSSKPHMFRDTAFKGRLDHKTLCSSVGTAEDEFTAECALRRWDLLRVSWE